MLKAEAKSRNSFGFVFKNKASQKGFFFQKPIVLLKVSSLLTDFGCESIE